MCGGHGAEDFFIFHSLDIRESVDSEVGPFSFRIRVLVADGQIGEAGIYDVTDVVVAVPLVEFGFWPVGLWTGLNVQYARNHFEKIGIAESYRLNVEDEVGMFVVRYVVFIHTSLGM